MSFFSFVAFGRLCFLVCANTSEGCSSAVKRVLGKIDGVTDIKTDVAAKSVVVQADESVSPQEMLEKLQKVIIWV